MISFQYNRRKFMAACASAVAFCFSPGLLKRRQSLQEVVIKSIDEVKPGMQVCGNQTEGLFTIVERADSPCFADGMWVHNDRHDLFWGTKDGSPKRLLLCFYDLNWQKTGHLKFYA